MSNLHNNLQAKSYIGLIPSVLLFAFVYRLMALDLNFLDNYTLESAVVFVLAQLVILFAYNRRIRLVFIVAVTALLYFIVMRLGIIFSEEEFDTFTNTLHYRLIFTVILLGYISAFFMLWYKWGSVAYSLFMIALGMPYIIMQDGLESSGYLMFFSVLLVLAVAVVLISDVAFRNVYKGQRLSRYVLYSVLALLLMAGVITLVGQGSHLEIEQIDDLQRGYSDSSLVQNKEGRVSVNKSMRPGGSNTNSNQLLFVAKIDNYFEIDGRPNPLYLTTYNYSLFDSAKQEFMTDSLAPDEDIFRPDMSEVAPGFSRSDSLIYNLAYNYKNRHTVKMTLFNKGLALDEFMAPYTAYTVTKMPLSADLAEEYVSSYTTYSLVSDFNSAYFIYNPYNASQALLDFQELRFAELRKYNDYEHTSPSFMRYYTAIPAGETYSEIKALADELVAKSGASTTLDKVLAVRDYYLSENLIGQPLFEYTDNPGVPGVPNANLLNEFLFNTHKGYCAYFAGAGLMLLRSMGVPSRLAVGFLTVDRSDKSPGWYWYYQNQAHAWVQVYFPELGWMDFDFTIGNDQARESSQADGTPPVMPTEPDFTALVQVLSADTSTSQISARTLSAMYRGDSMLPLPSTLDADLSQSMIVLDTATLGIEDITKLDTLALIISDLDAKVEPHTESEDYYLQNKQTLHPERVEIIRNNENKDVAAAQSTNDDAPQSLWSQIAKALLAVFLILLFLPLGLFFYLFLRNLMSRNYKDKAYYNNMSMLHFMHQIGLRRGGMTNLEFAQNKVDKRFGIDYESFVRQYLRLKYDDIYSPGRNEVMEFKGYFTHEWPQAFRQLSTKEKLQLLFNPARTINFISKYLTK